MDSVYKYKYKYKYKYNTVVPNFDLSNASEQQQPLEPEVG